jgi:polar amino acid transport system substrate-binding protein
MTKPIFSAMTVVTAGVLGGLLAASGVRADLLDDIKKKGEITVATEARFQPFEYVEDGKIVGYGPDMMKMVFEKYLPGVKIKQLDLPFQGILPGLSAKKWDVVITAVTVTKARTEKYNFTTPIGEATVAVLKKTGDSTVGKPQDMAGQVVGTQAGSAQLEVLKGYSAKLAKDGGKGASEIKEYVGFDEAYADLAAGRIKAVAQTVANVAPIVKARPETFELLKETIGPKTYFSWVARKDEDSASLVKLLNDGLLELKKSGKMAELQKQWVGFTMDLPDEVGEPSM